MRVEVYDTKIQLTPVVHLTHKVETVKSGPRASHANFLQYRISTNQGIII